MRLFTVYGNSNTGKTTLLTNIIKALKNEGKKVAYLKLTKHKGPFDVEGKDTQRARDNGADKIGLVHDRGVVLWDYTKKPHLVDLIRRNFLSFDFVLIEGNAELAVTRIKCISKEEEKDSDELVLYYCSFADIKDTLHPVRDFARILSIVKERSVPLLPHLDCAECGFPTCKEFLQNYLEGRVKIRDCKVLYENAVVVRVNGKRIEMKSFVQEFVGSTILGALSVLRGFEYSGNVEIKIDVNALLTLKEGQSGEQR